MKSVFFDAESMHFEAFCHASRLFNRVACNMLRIRAENGNRTRDPQLGKLMLYQLSYFRKRSANIIIFLEKETWRLFSDRHVL